LYLQDQTLGTQANETKSIHASHGRAPASSCTHSVHFYESDGEFLDSLSQYVGAALGTGGACMVIATKLHRHGLADRLRSCGIDLDYATRSDRYTALDAAETLAKFMVGGWPDEQLFQLAIEPALLRARTALAPKTDSVAAFGEMVALLWEQNQCEAALKLEQLWNELVRRQSFSLRCAYPLGCFSRKGQEEWFHRVCAEHGAVVPAESYTTLDNENDRLRMVSSLQQKAQTLQFAVEEREREIAQRIEVEEKLRRSEEFANKVVENSVDCVKVLDLEGRLEYMSPPGQRALGIENIRQILGGRWVDFWKEEDQPRAEAALKAARTGGVGSFQGDIETVGGMAKSWDVRITPALGKRGEVERLVAISRDITELKFAQQVVIQSEKLAAAGRLAATIAHEINNPLEAVTNFIYLSMTSEGVPEEVRRHLEIADRELVRVAQIAQQTLGFYKDNSRRKWFSVAEVIQDVFTLYDRKLRNKRLHTDICADPEIQIFAKQGEMKQALSNLVTNAIDASNEGGKLWVRAQRTKNWTNGMEEGIRITLADNGCGMAPEVRQRIFVPFFTTKAEVGTGIGLWVTKCLVEQQGGYIRFRSRQGRNAGTVMSFFVPRACHENVSVAGLS
jgi:PAS domain S-box-containing protein